MSNALHLPAGDRALLKEILMRNAPGIEVWAYGSRVNGTIYEASALDLALRGASGLPVRVSMVNGLIDAFDESTLPIVVDIHDWGRLPPEYQEEIERSHYMSVQAQ